MASISVILADDHDLVREGIARLLESFGGMQVVAHAGDGYEALEQVQRHLPDVIILDISMPRLRGLEAIKEILKISPKTKVVVLSMHNKEKYIQDAMENGASAYLLKESAVNDLYIALNVVVEGGTYFSPQITLSNDSEKSKTPLTKRERQIVTLLAEGHSTKDIAALLYISPKTVETHRHHINTKLNAGSMADLVKYAIKEELISID